MLRHRKLSGAGALIILIAAVTLTVRSQGRTVEWRYFGGDKAFTRYSSADQITRDNVKNLRIAWRRPAVDEKLTQAFPGLRVNAFRKFQFGVGYAVPVTEQKQFGNEVLASLNYFF